jgi:hypothetical protein
VIRNEAHEHFYYHRTAVSISRTAVGISRTAVSISRTAVGISRFPHACKAKPLILNGRDKDRIKEIK